MTQRILIAVVLAFVVLVGCAPKAAPPVAPAPMPEVTPVPSVPASEDISTVEADVGELDELTDELDISDLESLDAELAELDTLELG